MVPYTIGNCVVCGAQAMVRNPDGKVVCGLPGSILVNLVCTGPVNSQYAGVQTRFGQAPICPIHTINDITPNELKISFQTSPLQFMNPNEPAFIYLTDLTIEFVARY